MNSIAIVGLSGRYPGGANTLDQLWETLVQGRDAVGEVDGSRWSLSWHNPDQDRNDRIYTRAGGFIDDIDGFDADFFNISPREAAQMDPQQRMMLELAWEAFESAGLPPHKMAGTKTGVFVGISNQDYSALGNGGYPDAYTNIGIALSISANRVSYVFDLHGPSLAVDTACSSSLVGIHQACRAIASGDCSMALAGGVNVLIDNTPWLGFSRASMLSPDGRCTSFDANGKGYVRSEGGGFILLKSLEQAERDNDPILAVVRGTGVNSDGKTMGLPMPNVDAQAALLEQVYRESEVDLNDVFYVEAHGTGTSVGDPIECESIGRAIGQHRNEKLPIGSVKSNIGHLESGSGIAGLTKVLLGIKNRKIPANLHFNVPNPDIDFENWRLDVVDEHLEFPDTDHPLLFGVNSFGFGGTNAHMIVQEYKGENVESESPRAHDLLILNASSEGALRDMAASYARMLRGSEADFDSIAATAALCRSPLKHRLAVRADNNKEAAEKLDAWLAEEDLPTVAAGSVPGDMTNTVFVYSGNGPQWWGMGRELLAESEIYRAQIEAVDRVFAPLAGWSLIDEMARSEEDNRIQLTEIAQPMLFAMQVGLTEILRNEGVQPKFVYGHSVGEVAAAWAAGALTLDQATTVIFYRSNAQAKTVGSGKMAALGIDAETTQELLDLESTWLEIAAINGPDAVTVAGDPEALQALVDKLTNDGKFARLLQIDYPFHTKAMDPIREDLLQSLGEIRPQAGDVPFISTVDGVQRAGDTLNAEYWFENVRRPVKFNHASEHLLSERGATYFVEIGPHPVVKDYVAQTAKAGGQVAATSQTLRRPGKNGPESDLNNLAKAIATSHANGASELDDLFEMPVKRADLPSYPWQRERHWRGHPVLPDGAKPQYLDHPLLGSRVPATTGQWVRSMDTCQLPYLADHVVRGAPLFPAAGYVEMTLAAAALKFDGGKVFDIESYEIQRPLAFADGTSLLVQTSIDDRDGTVDIVSLSGHNAADSTLHMRARVSHVKDFDTQHLDLPTVRGRLSKTVTKEDHYAESNRRGLEYGPNFQGIQSIQMSDPEAAEREALSHIKLDGFGAEEASEYRLHPGLLDSCLQTFISLIAQNDPRPVSTIPVRFDRVRSFAPFSSEVMCLIKIKRESSRSAVVDFWISDLDGRIILIIEGARCQKVDLMASAASPLLQDWWRLDEKSPSTETLGDLSDPLSVLGGVKTALAGVLEDKDSQTIGEELNRIACLYAADAVDALRGDLEGFDLKRLSREARLRRNKQNQVAKLLEMSVVSGRFEGSSEEGWYFNERSAHETPQEAWAELFNSNPSYQAELLALADSGERLVASITGQDEHVIDDALLVQIENASPIGLSVNSVAHAAVKEIVTNWPGDRPMRILELHGSTGGLTSWILPLTDEQRTEYWFTDPSEEFVDRAARRFKSHQSVKCELLPTLLGGEELSLPQNYFDLVILSDVKGQIPNKEMLQNALVSYVASDALFVAISPAKTAATLLMVNDESSEVAQEISQDRNAIFECLHVGAFKVDLRIAQFRHSPKPRAKVDADDVRHLFIAYDDVFAQAAAKEFNAMGFAVDVHKVTKDGGEAADILRSIEATKSDRVVFFGGTPTDDLISHQVDLSLKFSAMVEAVEAARKDANVTVTVVTSGAFPNPNSCVANDPNEAVLWGLGRVVRNEYPAFEPRQIDIYPDHEGKQSAKWLAEELARRDDETEVQICGGHRYVNRLRFNTATDIVKTAHKTVEGFALDFASPGGIDSLHLVEKSRRAPGPNEVEILVKAAGLNFRDVLWCMDMLPEEALEHGFSGATIGMECAGEILRVGENVDHLAKGDRVVAFASSCFGSHVTTVAKSVAKLPDNVDYVGGATVPTTFLTAWYALDHLARLEKGETVLIHGAAGGVGLAAIQIAKQKGATVIGTAGSSIKRKMLELLGVDHVLNSRTLKFADQVVALTDGKGVDVVLNSLAGEAIIKNLGCLRPFGRFLEIGKVDFYANSRIGLRPFRNNLSYFGIDADTLLVERPELAQRLFQEVVEQFENGTLNPLPNRLVPISQAADGFRAMQQARHVGKLVISLELDDHETLPVVPNDPRLGTVGTYVITGGLAGFGLTTAKWLAEQGATSLALVSRSGASTEEAKEAIEELTHAGISVEAFATDVSDQVKLSDTLDQVRSRMEPIIGVVHAAAVIEDVPLTGMNTEQLERVYKSKMLGAWNLHVLTKEDPIETFVLYSSTSAIVGNPGQGAYVAANLYLDALALQRKAEGLPALSIGWGAIADAGFLTRNQNVAGMLKSRTGLDATPAHDALADFARLSAAGATRMSVARFDLHKLRQMLPAAMAPRFEPIIPTDMSAGQGSESTLSELLKDKPKSEQMPFIIERIKESTARVLGTSANQIDVEKPLSNLGLDSLMAVELASTLERDTGETIPVMQLVSAESLLAVAEFVAKTLGVVGESAVPVVQDPKTEQAIERAA